MKKLLSACFLLLGIAAYGQGKAVRFDALSQMVTNVKPSAVAVNQKLVIEVAGYSTPGDWGPSRIARWDKDSTASTNLGCVFATAEGTGRWIFDDCFGGGTVSAEWFGGKPDTATGYTNRLTWQSITRDSRAAVQDAINFVSSRGGGTIKFGPGDWRFGDSSNPGTLYLKPNVSLEGLGSPMGDDTFEGTFSSTNIMRTMHQTILHFSGASTNGYGAPCIALIGSPNYTNQYYTAFTDHNSEWVYYYRGGNSIRNLGIYPGWKWSWNGANPTAAAIYINEVAGTTIENVWIGPTTGPGVYVRGGFGTRIYNSIITTPLASGIVLVDTSDTIIERNTISAARGASLAIVRANTHVIRNNSFWNNAEDLVGWVGTGQSITNVNTTETAAVRRTGFTADASTDLINTTNRIGSDTGLPVMFRGTSLPGGVDTNTVYFVRWNTQGGTNFYLTTSAGRALNASGTVVDITSAGTPGSWWLEGPSGQIWLRDMEEAEVMSLRSDQSFSGIVDAARVVRSKFANIHAWELGLNQTEVRQSRKQTWFDPAIIAFRLEDCSDITISGSQIIGSKGNSGLSTPWDHVAYGVYLLGSADIAISGNTFDRLNTAIYADGESANVSTDGNQFGGWVSRPIDSVANYGIAQHVPYFDGKTNSQIVGTIPSAYTNITGDFAIAMKVRIPSLDTNGFANGRHSALFNLTTSTNTVGNGSLTNKSVSWSIYRSPSSGLTAIAGIHGGTNYSWTVPLAGDERYSADVSTLVGQDVELLIQRTNNVLEIWVEGFKRATYTLTSLIGTNTFWGPYLVVGQIADSGQFSHPQAPIYSLAYHQKGFSNTEINKGIPWSRKDASNAIVYWDFSGASLAQGVLDLSGNSVNGVVQQIGATALVFGPSKDFIITSGTGITATRSSKNSYSVSVDSEGLQDTVGAMIVGGVNTTVTYNDAGGTVTIDGKSDESIQDLLSTTLVAGANITLTYDDPGNTLTIASTGGGGSTNGSSAFFNSSYLSAFNLTSSADITNVVSGTNVAPTLITQSGVAGTYTNPVATVNSKGIITSITNGSASSGGGGETNTASNLGTPSSTVQGLYNSKSGVDLRFRSLEAGANITLTSNANTVTITSTGGGSSSNTIVLVEGTTVTNPNFTNTDANIDLSIASSTNVVVNMSTNPSVVQLNAGTVYVTNAMDVIVGATGRSNLTSEAYLVGQGTNAVKLLGPTANAIAGWNGSTATALTTGVGVTNTGGVVSANLAAGSNITLSTNANGQVSIASSGGGGSTITTNILGYVERSVVLVTNDHTIGELAHHTITIPANTLSDNGDEVEIHIPGTFSAYTTGTNSAYTFRWSFDSALGGADNVHVVNMASTYFTQTSTEYSLDWKLRIKRIDSNTVVTSSEHFAGPHVDAGSTNNLVSAIGTMWIDFDGNLGTDPADFTFYTDIVDDTRAARLKTFGFFVHKVGSGGSGGASAFNDLTDVDSATPTTNQVPVWTGATYTKTNSLVLQGLSIQGTNYGRLFLADSSASTTPPGVQLRAPDVVQTNYSRILASNALGGLVLLTGDNATNQTESVVSTSAGVLGAVSDETGSGALVGGTSPTITTPLLSAPTISNQVTYPLVSISPSSSATNFIINMDSANQQFILATNNVYLLSFDNLPASGYAKFVYLWIQASGANRQFFAAPGGTGTNINRSSTIVSSFTITNGDVARILIGAQTISGTTTNVNLVINYVQ